MLFSRQTGRLSLRWLGPLVAAAACSASGCAKWNMRGAGYPDEEANPPIKARANRSPFEMSGFDERSRQIERSLGASTGP